MKPRLDPAAALYVTQKFEESSKKGYGDFDPLN